MEKNSTFGAMVSDPEVVIHRRWRPTLKHGKEALVKGSKPRHVTKLEFRTFLLRAKLFIITNRAFYCLDMYFHENRGSIVSVHVTCYVKESHVQDFAIRCGVWVPPQSTVHVSEIISSFDFNIIIVTKDLCHDTEALLLELSCFEMKFVIHLITSIFFFFIFVPVVPLERRGALLAPSVSWIA